MGTLKHYCITKQVQFCKGNCLYNIIVITIDVADRLELCSPYKGGVDYKHFDIFETPFWVNGGIYIPLTGIYH